MPRKPIYLSKIDEWVLNLEQKRYSPATYKKSYPSYARRAYGALKENGMTTDPRKIGKQEAIFVINTAFQNRPGSIAGWNNFLKFCGNPILEITDYAVAQTPVMNADWLNLDRYEDLKVWQSCTEPLERLLIHMELHLCMRNIEVRRQKLSWFGSEDILVLGKGKFPGKYRRIAYHPYTLEILAEVRKWRAANEKAAGQPLPDNITAYWNPHHKKIVVPGETKLRNVLADIKIKAGLDFAHHTLRRTGARRLWKAGARIEKISKLLGHESIDQTKKYLGINIEDQKEMQEMGHQYDMDRMVHYMAENPLIAR